LLRVLAVEKGDIRVGLSLAPILLMWGLAFIIFYPFFYALIILLGFSATIIFLGSLIYGLYLLVPILQAVTLSWATSWLAERISGGKWMASLMDFFLLSFLPLLFFWLFLKGNTFFHFLPSWWMYRFIAGLHLSAGKEIFWSFLFLLAYFFLSFLLYHLCSSLPFLPPLKGKSFIPLKGLAFPYSGILLFTVREAKTVARDLELITYTLLGLTWILGLTALLRSAHLDHALMALLPAASYLSIAVLSPFPLTARGRKGERDPSSGLPLSGLGIMWRDRSYFI